MKDAGGVFKHSPLLRLVLGTHPEAPPTLHFLLCTINPNQLGRQKQSNIGSRPEGSDFVQGNNMGVRE